MRAALTGVVLASLTPMDGYADQSLPFSCAQLRWYASFHSAAELEAKAREYRLNRTQIRQARACLREKQ